MRTPSVLVLRAAGTNCERETAFAFQRFGARVETLHVNRVLSDPGILRRHHVLAIPGGFSYGDDVAAGAVLAAELGTVLAGPLTAMLDDGGLVLGICNGFQVLTRLGLLPGLEAPLGRPEATLADNASLKYEDRWVRLAIASRRCVFVGEMEPPELPVAHAEGRLVVRDDEVGRRLVAADRVVFRYADAEGRPTDGYPDNPNGSRDAIAGLTDATGRVLGLMPHPERALFGFHHPDWTGEVARDGRPPPEFGPGAPLFANACAWVRENR